MFESLSNVSTDSSQHQLKSRGTGNTFVLPFKAIVSHLVALNVSFSEEAGRQCFHKIIER